MSRVTRTHSVALVIGLLALGCSDARRNPAPARSPSPTYAEARAGFRTRLLRRGPAPQPYSRRVPPVGARVIPYRSGTLALEAWVSEPVSDGSPRPAVLFLHGGFAFGEGDWEMTEPFRDAGYVVLVPMLRAENGLPGEYSLLFHEVSDVLAAAETLAALPYVLRDRLYIAGHSIGGTLTLLAAMRSTRFRAAASFAASPDQFAWAAGSPELVPFDPNDVAELRIRSPIAFPTSLMCPTRLYYGTAETYFVEPSAELAARAREGGLDVQAIAVNGDHSSHVPEAIRQSIVFFRAHP